MQQVTSTRWGGVSCLPWAAAEWSCAEGGKWRPSACLVSVSAVVRCEALAFT